MSQLLNEFHSQNIIINVTNIGPSSKYASKGKSDIPLLTKIYHIAGREFTHASVPNRLESAHIQRMKRATREKRLRLGLDSSDQQKRELDLSVRAKQIHMNCTSESPTKNHDLIVNAYKEPSTIGSRRSPQKLTVKNQALSAVSNLASLPASFQTNLNSFDSKGNPCTVHNSKDLSNTQVSNTQVFNS